MRDSRADAPAWAEWWSGPIHAADGMTVNSVGKPVSGNVSVDERITLDLRVRVNEPQPQSGSGCKYRQGED